MFFLPEGLFETISKFKKMNCGTHLARIHKEEVHRKDGTG